MSDEDLDLDESRPKTHGSDDEGPGPSTPPRSNNDGGGDRKIASGPGPTSPTHSGGGGAAAGVKSPARSAATGQPLNHDLITLKVAIVGPKQSGKTVIANHLAGLILESVAPSAAGNTTDAGNNGTERYDPTMGVRILEFERDITGRSRDGKATVDTKVIVELWDCSGDARFEGCWAAVTKDLLGLIVVFDPKSKQHTAEIKAWCEWFAKSGDLDSNQCALFAFGTLNSQHPPFGPIKTGKKTVTIPVVNVNTNVPAGDDPKKSSVSVAFRQLIGEVYGYHKLADFS